MKKGLIDQMLEDEGVQKALDTADTFFWIRGVVFGLPLLIIILICLLK